MTKYFNIYVSITSCYKVTNCSAAMNYFLCGFPGVFWCARMICFLCDMNIQQIILPADDQHALVNKHAHNSHQEVSAAGRAPKARNIYYYALT